MDIPISITINRDHPMSEVKFRFPIAGVWQDGALYVDFLLDSPEAPTVCGVPATFGILRNAC